MQLLLVVLTVLVLSVLASSRLLLQATRFPVVAQLSASGLLFLVFGAALGPRGLALLSRDDLGSLSPLLSLAMGVSGVLVGINLDPRMLQHLPLRAYAASALQSGLAFILVAIPSAALLEYTTGLRPLGVAGAAAMLGAAASVSSAHYAVLWTRSGRLERMRGLSVALVAMLDDVVGLAALAIALLLGAGGSPSTGVGLVALALLLGVVSGALTTFLIAQIRDRAELTAILLGATALVAGAAAYLRISALLSGVAFGLTLALTGGSRVAQEFRALARIERPTYLIILFLVGAHVDARDVLAWALVPVFVAFRFFGKLLGGRLATRAAASLLSFPRELGLALLAQGGVGACVAMEYLLLVRRPGTQLVFDVVVVAMLLNELIAARAMVRAVAPRGGSPGVPERRAA